MSVVSANIAFRDFLALFFAQINTFAKKCYFLNALYVVFFFNASRVILLFFRFSAKISKIDKDYNVFCAF